MNIGLIVYSYTGNTQSVAEKIAAGLRQKGHTVTIERVKAREENPNYKLPIELVSIPDPSLYDQLILAAPVNGFSLAAVMKAYLQNRPQLAGKSVRCFVTHHFPKAWLGGNQTINQFKAALIANKAVVLDTGVINWTNKKRDEEIVALVDRFSKI